MKHRKTCLSVLLFASCVFASLGCGEKVPIQEMSAAKMEITKAESVKADQYAPEEIRQARTTLMESHTQVAKNDTDDAAKTAVAARVKAEEAYNKAVPLLAKDSIETAEKSFEGATEAYAESLAKDEYLLAQTGVKSANEQFQNKQFYDAHLKALAADEDARKARDIAIGKKSVLSDSIVDVNVTVDRARKYHAEKHAGENLRLAEENVKIANESLGTLKLKQGFSAVEVAKMNADEALAKSMRGTSGDRIGEAKTLLDQAEKSPGALTAKTDLAMARESLKSSEELNANGKYPESISAAEDSQRLSRLVIGAKAAARIDLSMQGKDKAGETGKSPSEIDLERGYSIYVVRLLPGNRDCLWRIARQYYGDGLKYRKIFDANRDRVRNPNLIKPGWQLKIPLGDAMEKKVQEKKEPKQEPKAGANEENGGGARVEEPEY